MEQRSVISHVISFHKCRSWCSLGTTATAWVFWVRYCSRLSWNWQEDCLRTVWRSRPMRHLTPVLARMSRTPCTDMKQIERFVVLLYQRTSALNQVNEAGLHLFTQHRKMDYIPPTLSNTWKAIFGHSFLMLTLNFHRQVCGVIARQLLTIRGFRAGLSFQRQQKLANNCWNVGVEGMFQEMQVCESKPTMHKPLLLYGTM